MKRIIDIPNEIYDVMKNNIVLNLEQKAIMESCVYHAILNSTLLDECKTEDKLEELNKFLEGRDSLTDEEQRTVLKKLLIILFEDEYNSVLEDIKAEIDQLVDRESNSPSSITIYSWNTMKKKVFEIIDSHMNRKEQTDEV